VVDRRDSDGGGVSRRTVCKWLQRHPLEGEPARGFDGRPRGGSRAGRLSFAKTGSGFILAESSC
jgi:hypothetical protein